MQDMDTDAIAENAAFLQRPYNPEPATVPTPGPLGRYLDQRGSGESRQVSLDTLSRTLREERRRRARPSATRLQGAESTLRTTQNSDHAAMVDEMINRAGTRVRMPPHPSSAIQAARERYNSLLEMREAHDRTQQQEMARTPYSNGAPHAQTLYDWAPAVTMNNEADLLDLIYRRLREQQPNTHGDVLRQLARQEVEDVQRTAAQQARRQHIIQEEERQRALWTQEQQDQATGTSITPSTVFDRVRLDLHERSVHSAQILRDMRRQSALTARSRDLMTRYALEREQAQQNATPPVDSRIRTPSRLTRTGNSESRYELNRLAWQASQRSSSHQNRDERESADLLRRRYLDNPVAPTPKISEFERIIKYLHLLSDDEIEVDRPLTQLEGFTQTNQQNAKSVDGHRLRIACPPHPTSWLVPGMVFSGAQQSAGALGSSFGLQRPGGAPYNLSTTGERRSTHHAEYEPIFYTATPIDHVNLEHPDRWVVRVSIHDIDYNDLTLQGTMEAFNVPNAASPPTADPNKTTFSTYLTGELLDFHRHTLLTSASSLSASQPCSPSLNSATSNATLETTPDVDALYWRALPPFNQISDSDLARGFLDPNWIEREISQKYVLMRWKERSFVSPSYEARENTIWAGGRRPQAPEERSAQFMPGAGVIAGNSSAVGSGHGSGSGLIAGSTGAGGRQFGLSISGFYYVSLRRSDGKLEGLYFDPQSSPYQRLELRPERKNGGMWMCGSAEVI